jgi:hypothetical protein
MTVADTPDYQRGVVAPEQPLGTLDNPIVFLPPNCETLILHNPTGVYEVNSVVGLVTGTYYPWVALAIPAGSPAGSIYLALVSQVLDAAVQISVTGPGDSWYAIADTAARTGPLAT